MKRLLELRKMSKNNIFGEPTPRNPTPALEQGSMVPGPSPRASLDLEADPIVEVKTEPIYIEDLLPVLNAKVEEVMTSVESMKQARLAYEFEVISLANAKAKLAKTLPKLTSVTQEQLHDIRRLGLMEFVPIHAVEAMLKSKLTLEEQKALQKPLDLGDEGNGDLLAEDLQSPSKSAFDAFDGKKGNDWNVL